MPMAHPAAKTAVRSQIDSVFGAIPSGLLEPEQELISTARDNLADSIAQFVDYIQANALVATNDVGEVTSGAGSGGSVVATGVGTVE